MERVLTAEEFYQQAINDLSIGDDITDLMNAYARLHVEAALKAASEKVEHTIDTDWVDFHDFSKGHNGINVIIDKDSILNSYPLENIK